MTDKQALVDAFWEDLGTNQRYYNEPEEVISDFEYEMSVVSDKYAFDVLFWRVFDRHPFFVVATNVGADNMAMRFRVDEAIESSQDSESLSSYLGDD